MGIFDKLCGKKGDDRVSGQSETEIRTPYYFNWLSRYMGIATIRQNLFWEVIGSAPAWRVDMGERIITFDDLKFPVMFLGSESYSSNTWLWGWVNVNGYSEAAYKDSEVFYRNCMMMQMNELEKAELPLTKMVNGHTLASLAVAASTERFSFESMFAGMGRICYYKAPYDGGAAFFLVNNIPEQVFAAIPAVSAVNAISKVIAGYPLHHGYLVDGIMEVYATHIQKNADRVAGKFYDGSVLTVEFDGRGRIQRMNTDE